MPSVGELSAPYANFMLNPRRGADVCVRCFNLTDGYERCYACVKTESVLAAMVPISYSVAHEQLHHALASYKRLSGTVARRLTLELAAVLWRFLALHEECLAGAAGVDAFQLVTTVPSSDLRRDRGHPLRTIVGEIVGATRHRYRPLLQRSELGVPAHTFNAEKYTCSQRLHGEAVLLIDDTWTTGANAQSAAAAMQRAGAGPVATLVIGRHVNREWHANDRHLQMCVRPFDWSRCGLCETDQPAPAPRGAVGRETSVTPAPG